MASIAFPQIIERGCGLDVHKETIVATVKGNGIEEHTLTFGTFTSEIESLAGWLSDLGVTHIAMEMFKENMQDLDTFLSHEVVELLQIGEITSDRYSRIAAQLKRQGTPIPTNDIWIAAQTMEHGAELVTSDQHFEQINGLVCTIF